MRRYKILSTVPGTWLEAQPLRAGGFPSSARASARAQSPAGGAPRRASLEGLMFFLLCVKPNSDYGSLINLSSPLPSLSLSLSLQVPKVTQAHPVHLAHLGPRALQVPQGPLEEDPKPLGSQTCSTASAQVTNPCPREPASFTNGPNSWASLRLCDRIF